jgi:hypothetical protein
VRRSGPFYRAMGRRKPSVPAESGYVSAIPRNRNTGRLRSSRPGKPRMNLPATKQRQASACGLCRRPNPQRQTAMRFVPNLIRRDTAGSRPHCEKNPVRPYRGRPGPCADPRGKPANQGAYRTPAGDPAKPPARKRITFLSSEKIGFKAYYDKTYYGVKFLDFLNEPPRRGAAGEQTPLRIKTKNQICRGLPKGLFTIPFLPA